MDNFAVASKLDYAAVLYLRIVNRDSVYVNQLLAKTKVALIKTQSIPRLELCAVHLFFMHSFKQIHQFYQAEIHLWYY